MIEEMLFQCVFEGFYIGFDHQKRILIVSSKFTIDKFFDVEFWVLGQMYILPASDVLLASGSNLSKDIEKYFAGVIYAFKIRYMSVLLCY